MTSMPSRRSRYRSAESAFLCAASQLEFARKRRRSRNPTPEREFRRRSRRISAALKSFRVDWWAPAYISPTLMKLRKHRKSWPIRQRRLGSRPISLINALVSIRYSPLIGIHAAAAFVDDAREFVRVLAADSPHQPHKCLGRSSSRSRSRFFGLREPCCIQSRTNPKARGIGRADPRDAERISRSAAKGGPDRRTETTFDDRCRFA